MKRYFDLNLKTYNNYCDIIDLSYMHEIPDDGNPYGIVDGELKDISQTPEYIAEQEAKAKAIQDAKTITKRQLLFWLFQNKNIKEANILTAISNIEDENNRYLGEISYNGTNNFQYGNPFVAVIGQALGLTTQDLIKCFDEAINL